jgi:hypothetical protein
MNQKNKREERDHSYSDYRRSFMPIKVPALKGGQEVRRPRAQAGWGPSLNI